MITIADVAKRAGVSKMTVSRVINNSGYIGQETRERVEQAIQELGYIPNALARSLRFKQTRIIGLIVTDITNPFFTTLARGVEDTASEQDFSVIFCNTDESPDEEARYVNVLMQKQVDGLLLVPAGGSRESLEALHQHKLPFVLLDRHIPQANVDAVYCDNAEGAYRLIKHLLDLGHERITVLSGPAEVSSAADRVAGCRRALNEAGLGQNVTPVYYGPFTVEGGYEAAKQALAAIPRPTAMFAANNFIAVGALRAIHEAGLKLVEDVSLVAFDDLALSYIVEPFMTIIEQPAYEMGQRATALLLDRLAGQGPDAPQEIVLPTQMFVRTSSGPPHVASVADELEVSGA